MIDCDNVRCRFNRREVCVNMRMSVRNGRCISSEIKMHRQKKTRETEINHAPVVRSTRNRILK
ncbi:hypothetical protein NXG27_04130 [Megasphaera paucivorans]|uniref:hypothetical protein n=1 Tax=Megasphaera paucivorans TaxID=349095 RepID=UPI00115F9C72|nr:hypothetical protein [Megasphaera paucivorans]